MLKIKQLLALTLAVLLCLCVFTGCQGKETKSSPENLVYDKMTGDFSFSALEGAETYIVGVSKIINDTTGQALQGINQSSPFVLPDGSTVYLWSEQTGSVAGLADDDGDGLVSGTVVYREYSSSASVVGAVITDLNQLPVGHYVLQAIAASTAEVPNPEPAVFEFTMAGALAAPEGFTASINEAGNIQITAPSSYYLTCLTETGLPEKMRFEVSDGSGIVETIELDDFSYTNSVNGPNKGFSFNNRIVTGTAALDPAKSYAILVTAVGDGGEILDASASAYMATATPALDFAESYDLATSGSADGLSISLTLGEDAEGNGIYELAASVSGVAVMRESGSFTASAEAEEIDGSKVFPEGTEIAFTTDKSDASAPVLDGVSLTAAVDGSSYYLAGSATLDGTAFDFTKGSSGSSWEMGSGEMGGGSGEPAANGSEEPAGDASGEASGEAPAP